MRSGQILKALPQECDWVCKKNSQGKGKTWKGFNLHLLSADGEIPLTSMLTGASVHDSQSAPYLLKKARRRTTFLYALADAAYDAKTIKGLVCRQGGVPIIDANPRRGKTKSPMDPDRERRYRNLSGAERIFSRLKDEFGATVIRVKGSRKVGSPLMFAVLPSRPISSSASAPRSVGTPEKSIECSSPERNEGEVSPEDPLKVMLFRKIWVKKETPPQGLSVKTNLYGLINVFKEAQVDKFLVEKNRSFRLFRGAKGMP